MKAEIHLTDEEWEALRSATKIDEVNEAVKQAVRDHIRRMAIEELIALPGKITIGDQWRDMDKAELGE